MLFAARAQRALRHAQRRAYVNRPYGRFGNEQILEPGKNVSVAVIGRCFFLRPLRNALDQR
jgi:hypothetical protein